MRKKYKSSKVVSSESDCQDDQDGYDGTDGTLRTVSVDNNKSRKDPVPPKKERDLGNRPDLYKRMGVSGEPVFHPSELSKVPGRVIERRTVQVFNLKTCLVKERFEMVYYAAPGEKPKWGYFPSAGHSEVVTRFEGTRPPLNFYKPWFMRFM